MDSVVHFEIPFDDRDRAVKFYSEMFGWQIQPFPVGDQSYDMAMTQEMKGEKEFAKPGAINGGLTPREGGSKDPILVIKVDSVEEKVEKLKASGSEVTMGPHQVGDFGLYAHVTDTEGNVIGIWEDLKTE